MSAQVDYNYQSEIIFSSDSNMSVSDIVIRLENRRPDRDINLTLDSDLTTMNDSLPDNLLTMDCSVTNCSVTMDNSLLAKEHPTALRVLGYTRKSQFSPNEKIMDDYLTKYRRKIQSFTKRQLVIEQRVEEAKNFLLREDFQSLTPACRQILLMQLSNVRVTNFPTKTFCCPQLFIKRALNAISFYQKFSFCFLDLLFYPIYRKFI